MLMKIEKLIKNGWLITFGPEYDGWAEVSATHNTFGDISATEEDIRIALNKVYSQAMIAHKQMT